MSAPTPTPTPTPKKNRAVPGVVPPYIYIPVPIDNPTTNGLQELFDQNGKPINSDPNKRISCSADCLVAYPEGSQYHGYYYCNKACASWRTTPKINFKGIIYNYDSVVDINGIKYYRYKISPIFNRYAASLNWPTY